MKQGKKDGKRSDAAAANANNDKTSPPAGEASHTVDATASTPSAAAPDVPATAASAPQSKVESATPPVSPDKPAPESEAARAANEDGPSAANRGNLFPIVGLGASAGGLAALEAFLTSMPTDSQPGMAFVVVQHLDPDHKSLLSELIRRHTRMQVFEVSDGMPVEPNCAYIIPPNKDLALAEGKLHLLEPSARRGLRLPIDFFFRSLAQDRGEQAIGIILSGNGTDGTLGLRAIKEAGGMTIVQEPQSAEYDGMPRSAIAAGLADAVLPPERMSAQLIAFVQRETPLKTATSAPLLQDVADGLRKIMDLLRAHTGHDFSNYKQNTIRRRVERRMVVNQIESLDQYVRMLRQTPFERDILFRELLIGVTAFFRDPAAFEAVRELVLPSILSERPLGQPIRIWVPACSTGEEAYSLAMLLHESLEKLGRQFTTQIFATDIDQESIEKARSGIFPANIAADVSPERLGRFFTHEEKDFYRVKKFLRDQLVFAEQDVIKDPPFSKLDLISCRNMLIYMEPVLQKKLIPLFHYALVPGGYLFLGTSESVGEFTNFFNVIERKCKLYRRKHLTFTAPGSVSIPTLPITGDLPHHPPIAPVKDKKPGLREITERMLLRGHTPACVAVNEQGEILYVHGRGGKYLELPPGEPCLNLLRAAREGLKIELANGLRKAVMQRQPVEYEGLEVRLNGGFHKVNVTIELAEAGAEHPNILLVTFQDMPPRPVGEGGSMLAEQEFARDITADEKDRQIAALERELRVKAETLQTTVEELETSNEELKSTNEELQSTNEELQSTNEELETSKEELQSVNEELVTVNSELQQKMEGLSRANNDMSNLLAGTGIGMLFVDHQLHIQRFTPAATQIIKLIQTDIGRPVSDLVSNLDGYTRLAEDVKAVLDTLIPREAEVRTHDGRWYLMRILPYRTVENVIEGAVLTFVDIAAQKRAEEQLRTLSADLEHRVQQRVAELERVNATLQQEIRQREQVETRRATEIAALTRLFDLRSQTEAPNTLQTLLDAAMDLIRADMGTLQLYDETEQGLRLAAHRGFHAPFLERFELVTAQGNSICAEAFRRGERVVVEDVEQDALLERKPELAVLREAGVKAVQSTPVLSRDQRVLGMFSTHWTQRHRPDEGTLRLLDLLARQLADQIEGQHSKRQER